MVYKAEEANDQASVLQRPVKVLFCFTISNRLNQKIMKFFLAVVFISLAVVAQCKVCAGSYYTRS